MIGGYRPAGSNGIDALLVGYYDDAGLAAAQARSRAGSVPHLRREVFNALKPHQVDDCPFVDLPQAEVIPLRGCGVTAEEIREMRMGDAGAGGAGYGSWSGRPRVGLRRAATLTYSLGQERARGAAGSERNH